MVFNFSSNHAVWRKAYPDLHLQKIAVRFHTASTQSGRLEFQIQDPKADIAPAYRLVEGFAPLRQERSVMFAAFATGIGHQLTLMTGWFCASFG